jgi:Bacterial transcriptional activator domain
VGERTLWGLPTNAAVEETITRPLLEERAKARYGWFETRIEFEGDPSTELEVLTVNQPQVERWFQLLMVALYRSGRADAASQVFERQAADLVTDGLEVGARLIETREGIQQQDPDLLARRPDLAAAAVGVSLVPQQLPAGHTDFVERTAEIRLLARLFDVAAAPAPQAVLVGAAGMGTSALRTHLGHILRAVSLDGQLYVKLTIECGTKAAAGVSGKWLRDRGMVDSVVPVEVEERAYLYWRLLAARRILIVIDDAAAVAQVRPLPSGALGPAPIVTTRDQMVTLTGAATEEPQALLHVAGDMCLDDESDAALKTVKAYAGSAGDAVGVAEAACWTAVVTSVNSGATVDVVQRARSPKSTARNTASGAGDRRHWSIWPSDAPAVSAFT